MTHMNLISYLAAVPMWGEMFITFFTVHVGLRSDEHSDTYHTSK